MILLVDAGNSRIKWTTTEGDTLSAVVCHDRPHGDFTPFADEHWLDLPPPARVLIANVAGPALAGTLGAWTETTWGLHPEFVVAPRAAHRVTNAYVEPQRLGADRWAALVAARRLVQGAVCVIDCGTAVTIDVLNAQGQHQGGLIVPGLTMMRQALLQNTQGIASAAAAAAGPVSLLARDTQNGVNGGTLYAMIALLDRITADVAAELSGALTRIITGGDAPTVLPLLAAPYRHEPDLVLHGLAALAGGGE